MSVTVDANVLVYAVDRDSAFHDRALMALKALADGPELLYLFWPVSMAFLRIVTHPSILTAPMPADEAKANVAELLGRPHVRSPGETAGFWSAFASVSSGVPVRGNLVPDAHLVALMREWGVETIVTRDRDFRKFDGVRVRDPFA